MQEIQRPGCSLASWRGPLPSHVPGTQRVPEKPPGLERVPAVGRRGNGPPAGRPCGKGTLPPTPSSSLRAQGPRGLLRRGRESLARDSAVSARAASVRRQPVPGNTARVASAPRPSTKGAIILVGSPRRGQPDTLQSPEGAVQNGGPGRSAGGGRPSPASTGARGGPRWMPYSEDEWASLALESAAAALSGSRSDSAGGLHLKETNSGGPAEPFPTQLAPNGGRETGQLSSWHCVGPSAIQGGAAMD